MATTKKKIQHTPYFWRRYAEQMDKGYSDTDAREIAAVIEDRHNAKARRQYRIRGLAYTTHPGTRVTNYLVADEHSYWPDNAR